MTDRTLCAALMLPLALAGCKTANQAPPEPEIRIEKVYIDNPVPCVPDNLGAPPEYPDTDDALRAAADAASRTALLWAGRLLRSARLGEVEPVIAGCRAAAE